MVSQGKVLGFISSLSLGFALLRETRATSPTSRVSSCELGEERAISIASSLDHFAVTWHASIHVWNKLVATFWRKQKGTSGEAERKKDLDAPADRAENPASIQYPALEEPIVIIVEEYLISETSADEIQLELRN